MVCPVWDPGLIPAEPCGSLGEHPHVCFPSLTCWCRRCVLLRLDRASQNQLCPIHGSSEFPPSRLSVQRPWVPGLTSEAGCKAGSSRSVRPLAHVLCCRLGLKSYVNGLVLSRILWGVWLWPRPCARLCHTIPMDTKVYLSTFSFY